MGRTNPVGSRLRGLLNWPSNVFHPTLNSYVKHLFQHSLIAEPGIRSSVNSIWINLTLLPSKEHPINKHPLHSNPVLDFSNLMQVRRVLGRLENNVRRLARRDPKYSSMFSKVKSRSLVEAAKSHYSHVGSESSANASLHIFQKGPIGIRLNVISNPLLNGEIAAKWVAKRVEDGANPVTVYKELLNGLSSASNEKALAQRQGRNQDLEQSQ